MQTVTLEVGGLFEELDHLGAQKQLNGEKGVIRASANPASGSVTVDFDEAMTWVQALRRTVKSCGVRCRGAIVPRHVCKPGNKIPVDGETIGGIGRADAPPPEMATTEPVGVAA